MNWRPFLVGAAGGGANEDRCRYSQGKATALVIDIGHQHTSVTALWEGMVLKKSKCAFALCFAVLVIMMNFFSHDGRHSQIGIDEMAFDTALILTRTLPYPSLQHPYSTSQLIIGHQASSTHP